MIPVLFSVSYAGFWGQHRLDLPAFFRKAARLGYPAVEVAADAEATGLGAAALAGLGVGVWRDTDELGELVRRGARYEPRMSADEVAERRAAWRFAVNRALLR